MSVPTEGPWDHGLYLLRNGTAEATYAANGLLRATSVKAAMDIFQGTADAAYHAVDDLDVTVETLTAGSTGSGDFVGDMPNKTLRLRLPRGEQGPGVGEGIASITSGRGFWPLRKALAAGTARVVAMGDSKTEGAGVEAVDQRWLDQLMGTLRARYAPSGDQGLGYLPAYYATFYGFPSAPTTSGSAVTVGNGGGLGNRSRHLEAGGSVTWTVPAWTAGVPLLVHFTQHPGHGSLQVVTGGTVRGTIATGGSTIESKVTAVTIPAGTTSITVRHQSGTGTGNAARVEGIVHRTATTGVTIYDGARSGAKLVDYSQGLVNDGAPLSDDWHFQALAAVQPHAVILAFGANDQASRTPAQWGADLRTVVDKAKAAAPGAGIIVLHGAQRTEDVTADPTRVLRFEAAARDAVGADPDVTILYESTLWKPTAGVDYTSSDPSGWLADTVHTGPAANTQIARYLAAQVTGADAATDAVEVAERAIQPAVTAAQAAQTSAASSASDADAAVTLAQEAQAAALEVPDANTAAMIGNSATQTWAAVQATMPQVNVKSFGAVGDGVTDDTAAIRAALAASKNVHFPPGVYVINYDVAANRRNFANFVDLKGVRITGTGAVLLDQSVYRLNGLNSVFSFTGCSDVEVTGLTYRSTNPMPSTEWEANLDKTGATVVYLERNPATGLPCDKIRVDITVEDARYGVRAGDHKVDGYNDSRDLELTVRGARIGYPVALTHATVRSIRVEVDTFHRAAYLAGVRGIGTAPVNVRCRNQYGATIAVLVANAITHYSDIQSEQTTIGSSDLNITATDTGSTYWKTQTSLTGLAMNYVTPCEFRNISFRFSITSTNTVAAQVGGFTLESAVTGVPFRWEPYVSLTNIKVSGAIDRTGQTAASNSLGEVYVRAYDGNDTTFAHCPRVSNFTLEDVTYVKGSVQTRPFFVEIPGAVDPIVLRRVYAPGVSASLSSPTQPVVMQGCNFAAVLASATPHSVAELVQNDGVLASGVATARISAVRTSGQANLGWTGQKSDVRIDEVTTTGTSSITRAGWLPKGSFVKAILVRTTSIPAAAAGQLQIGTAASPDLFGSHAITAGVNRITATGLPHAPPATADLRLTFVPTNGTTYLSGPIVQIALYGESFSINA